MCLYLTFKDLRCVSLSNLIYNDLRSLFIVDVRLFDPLVDGFLGDRKWRLDQTMDVTVTALERLVYHGSVDKHTDCSRRTSQSLVSKIYTP